MSAPKCKTSERKIAGWNASIQLAMETKEKKKEEALNKILKWQIYSTNMLEKMRLDMEKDQEEFQSKIERFAEKIILEKKRIELIKKASQQSSE